MKRVAPDQDGVASESFAARVSGQVVMRLPAELADLMELMELIEPTELSGLKQLAVVDDNYRGRLTTTILAGQ